MGDVAIADLAAGIAVQGIDFAARGDILRLHPALRRAANSAFDFCAISDCSAKMSSSLRSKSLAPDLGAVVERMRLELTPHAIGRCTNARLDEIIGGLRAAPLPISAISSDVLGPSTMSCGLRDSAWRVSSHMPATKPSSVPPTFLNGSTATWAVCRPRAGYRGRNSTAATTSSRTVRRSQAPIAGRAVDLDEPGHVLRVPWERRTRPRRLRRPAWSSAAMLTIAAPAGEIGALDLVEGHWRQRAVELGLDQLVFGSGEVGLRAHPLRLGRILGPKHHDRRCATQPLLNDIAVCAVGGKLIVPPRFKPAGLQSIGDAARHVFIRSRIADEDFRQTSPPTIRGLYHVRLSFSKWSWFGCLTHPLVLLDTGGVA